MCSKSSVARLRGCTARRVEGMRVTAAGECESPAATSRRRAAGVGGGAVRPACKHCQHMPVMGPGGGPDQRPRCRHFAAYVARL